jgi:hypothetical protein
VICDFVYLGPVDTVGVLQMLDQAASEADVRPALALLAVPEPLVDPDELKPAIRRAMLLLAAGGNPHRELELDGRAVTALAAELDRPERRAVVSRGLEALRDDAPGLDNVSSAIDELLLDAGLAWEAYACALLADELEDDL